MPARKKAETKLSPAREIAKQLNKAMGADTLKMGNDPSLIVRFLQTGVLPVDVMLEGGLPRGRVTEIYGNYSTLKSYIALCAIATTQADGGVCAVVDTEHSFDPEWAEALGVDVDELLVEHPPTGEEAVDVTEFLIRSGVDLVVWDSVAATLPKAEQEKMAGDKQQPARLAALMSQAMRKLTAANSQTAILCINQTREKVGIMFGNPESIPGGKALPFYASYRISVRKSDAIKEDVETFDGEKMRKTKMVVKQKFCATLIKSKLNSPHRDVYFTWDYRTGELDELSYLITYGLENGLIIKKDNSWKIKGSQTSHAGLPKFRGWLESNPKAKSKIRAAALASAVRPDQ